MKKLGDAVEVLLARHLTTHRKSYGRCLNVIYKKKWKIDTLFVKNSFRKELIIFCTHSALLNILGYCPFNEWCYDHMGNRGAHLSRNFGGGACISYQRMNDIQRRNQTG